MEEINKELEATYILINNSCDRLSQLVKQLPVVNGTGTTKKVKTVNVTEGATEGVPESARSTKKKAVTKKRVTKGKIPT